MDHIKFDSGIIGDFGLEMPCAHRWDTTVSGPTCDIEPETLASPGAGYGFAQYLIGRGVVFYDDLRFQADNAAGANLASTDKSPESGLTGSKMPIVHRVDTSRCDPRRAAMEYISSARTYADIGRVHDSLEALADAVESMVLSAEECTE